MDGIIFVIIGIFLIILSIIGLIITYNTDIQCIMIICFIINIGILCWSTYDTFLAKTYTTVVHLEKIPKSDAYYLANATQEKLFYYDKAENEIITIIKIDKTKFTTENPYLEITYKEKLFSTDVVKTTLYKKK